MWRTAYGTFATRRPLGTICQGKGIGLHHGLMVLMHGSKACVRRLGISAGSPSRLAWCLYTCKALWRANYGPSATERPLGTVHEEKGISSQFQVSLVSRYGLSSLSRRKTPFLPSGFLSPSDITAAGKSGVKNHSIPPSTTKTFP